MWPVGIALKAYWSVSDITPAAHTVPLDFEPIHFSGPVSLSELAAALFPLALLIALGVVAAYAMLRRLFDEPTAVVASLIIAISPYYLAESKVLHLDALLSTLMLLSALAMLVYRRERRRTWLCLSGVLSGLALLTKTPALFLTPFFALVLLVDTICQATEKKSWSVREALHRSVPPMLLYLLVLLVVYVALFPVLWVAPDKGLGAVKWGLTRHATTPHSRRSFFLGQIITQDPGWPIYAITLLLRASEVTLVFLIVGALLGAADLARRRRLPAPGTDTLLLIAYVIFFLIEISLPEKKIPRYALPTVPVLGILGAQGLVRWARGLPTFTRHQAALAMALPILVQASLVLSRHPYYGTIFNRIAGGPPAAARAILLGNQAEGFAELAAHLNEKPNAEQATVAALPKHVFNQTFSGTTVDIDERPADYVAFHRNYTVRQYKFEEWGTTWERYAARTPERRIDFDGVPYAWLYASLPADVLPEHEDLASVGERFQYLGYDLQSTELSPGDRFPVVLYWRATEPITDNLSIFIHLVNGGGQLIWQDDGAAGHGERPTWSWAPGETIADPHTVRLPAGLPTGDYALTAGLYDWRTGERLTVIRPSEEDVRRDRITVARLSIEQPATPPSVWIARALATMVLASIPIMLCRSRSEPTTIR